MRARSTRTALSLKSKIPTRGGALIIPTLRKRRQEDQKFKVTVQYSQELEASLGITIFCFSK